MKLTMSEWLQNLKIFGFCLGLVGSGISISMCSIGLGVYVGSLLVDLIFVKRSIHKYSPCPQFIFLAPLLCALLISLFISPYFSVSLRGLGKFLGGFLLFYAGFELAQNDRSLRWIIRTLLAVYFIAALAGAVQGFLGFDFIYFRPPIRIDVYTRITGPFKNYNDYGSFLVPFFPVLAALLLQARSQRLAFKLFLVLQACFLSYALYCSLSRAALLAALVSMFLFVSFFKFKKYAYAGLMALMGFLWFAPIQISLRFKELLQLSMSSSKERMLLIDTAISMIKASPVFGLGPNTYSIYFPMFKPKDYGGLMYAHNSYLQMATEIGLLGTGLYLLFLFAIFFHLGRLLKTAHKDSDDWVLCVGFMAGVGGLLVNALFESLLQSTQLRSLFWSFLGIAAALATRAAFSKREQLS